MDSLGEIYDREFFAEYSCSEPHYAASCAFIAAEIADRFRPKSAVDWGCGAGIHVGELCRRGVDAIGVDGVLVASDQRDPDARVVVADLRGLEPIGEVPDKYDLALCIDVLEHIEEADSDVVLDHILRGPELVILSCAPPFQGGHHHVNEQPRRYWKARMADRGWDYQRRETGAMERHFMGFKSELQSSWLYHNLCVYRPSS